MTAKTITLISRNPLWYDVEAKQTKIGKLRAIYSLPSKTKRSLYLPPQSLFNIKVVVSIINYNDIHVIITCLGVNPGHFIDKVLCPSSLVFRSQNNVHCHIPLPRDPFWLTESRAVMKLVNEI